MKPYAWVPYAFILARLGISCYLLLANAELHAYSVLILFYVAMITDYLDGYSSGYFDVDSAWREQADSTVDEVFFVALVVRSNMMFAALVPQFLIYLYIVTDILWYILDAVLWRKLSGYHTWLAKCAAYFALAAVPALYVMHWRMWFLLFWILCCLRNVEGIIIAVWLPERKTSIASLYHVYQLYKQKRNNGMDGILP